MTTFRVYWYEKTSARNNSAHIADHHDRLGENSGDHIRNPADHRKCQLDKQKNKLTYCLLSRAHSFYTIFKLNLWLLHK